MKNYYYRYYRYNPRHIPRFYIRWAIIAIILIVVVGLEIIV